MEAAPGLEPGIRALQARALAAWLRRLGGTSRSKGPDTVARDNLATMWPTGCNNLAFASQSVRWTTSMPRAQSAGYFADA